jgi:Zn-dependent peptidase ImmA (M78 family)
MAPVVPDDDTPPVPDFRGGLLGAEKSPKISWEVRRAVARRTAVLDFEGGSAFVVDEGADGADGAARIRARLGVSVADQRRSRDPRAALRLWIEAIEDDGVLVFQMSRVAVAECRGFSLYYDVLPVIVLNGADSASGRTFTLIHEYCHLLHRSGGICSGWGNQGLERACDAFAAELLMPEDSVREMDLSPDAYLSVERLSAALKVSELAAAIRLRDLGLGSDAMVSTAYGLMMGRLQDEKDQQKEKEGGPLFHVVHLRNLGERYVGSVLEAHQRGAIGDLEMAQLLEAKLATVDRMAAELAKRPG